MNIRDVLIFDEGYKLQAYNDTNNILSVGIGHNLEADPATIILHRRMKRGDTISAHELEALYERDINNVLINLRKNISQYDKYPEKYQIVLQNLAFNLGSHGLMQFHSMLYAMTQKNDDGVIGELLNSEFAHQLPHRAERLVEIIRGQSPTEYQPKH